MSEIKAGKKIKIPSLPKVFKDKLSKTGYTRGADDDDIYQNRVSRQNTVLINFSSWELLSKSALSGYFKEGYIVLIPPYQYFENQNPSLMLENIGLELGIDALIFYETRVDWDKYNPENSGFVEATHRSGNLNGQYVARVPATTSDGSRRRGFINTKTKGAGIRVYEYADKEMIELCKIQLEYLYWMCFDAEAVSLAMGMSSDQIKTRIHYVIQESFARGLSNMEILLSKRMLDNDKNTICPLCLEKISANGFFDKVLQAEGRDVHDLTITQLNLFHIEELRLGIFNHRIYNLGWGHHHCNVVTKDSGIKDTVDWMLKVVWKNAEYGYIKFDSENKEL